MKRWILFFATNLLVMIALSFIAHLVMRYLGISSGSTTGLFIFCFILGMGGSFFSLMISKWVAKKTMGLIPADSHPFLVTKAHEFARRSGLEKMPEVYLYPSPEINAFATGSSRNNSLVAVSTGLLEKMTEEERDAVLAHEIGHIANGDMVTMTLVQGVVNSLAMFVAYLVSMAIMNALRRGDDDEGFSGGGIGDFFLYHIIHSVIHSLVSFLALPLIMWVSRWREYRADAHSGKLVGKASMIAALESLQRNYGQLGKHDKSVEVMAISSRSSFMELFSSHPPLEKRIAALRKPGPS